MPDSWKRRVSTDKLPTKCHVRDKVALARILNMFFSDPTNQPSTHQTILMKKKEEEKHDQSGSK